jgi:hypothetical protein
MITKLADAKGRIVLGSKFANKTVIVEEIDDLEVRIIAAAVIPQRELWLHRNDKAMAMVQAGLAQARTRRFSKTPPDLKANDMLSDDLDR